MEAQDIKMKAQSLISDLKEDGFDHKQIADILCDGEALENLEAEGIGQVVIEEAYALVSGEDDQSA